MLFGTSGIRGLYGEFVNEKLAMQIANLFADKDVVIARDTRTTGESLAFAAISGILGKGKNVIYLGISPTPTLALATKKYKCKGIMITASHNPPEYNGLKFYENGREITKAQEKELAIKYETKKEKMKFSDWNNTGKLIEDYEAIQEHINLIKNLVDSKKIASRKPLVVVDSNGAGAVLTPNLLEQMGCDVISINKQTIGFGRPSEPNSENLKLLGEKVRELKADLGIGHDGDADRAVVVDEKGEVLPLDVQLAIMAEEELNASGNKIKKIVSTFEASLCIREMTERSKATMETTPVGSNYVSDAIEQSGAVFGGEPCGEYVFSNGLLVPDGPLTAAKFVELFCKKGKLSELKKKYKTYFMVREKLKCDNSKKYEIVEKIRKQIKTDGKIRTEDGIRVDEEDGWFLVRASGTEPFVRLTMEYKTQEKLRSKSEEIRNIIKKNIN